MDSYSPLALALHPSENLWQRISAVLWNFSAQIFVEELKASYSVMPNAYNTVFL